MTSTRASAVPRSRITRGAAPYQPPSYPARQAARVSRRGSPRLGSGAAGRGRAVRRRPGGSSLSGPAPEEAEEIPLGRQHEGSVLAVQPLAISLQRPIKRIELLVLVEGVGIDLDRLRVAVATHALRVALRLGEDHGALALGIGA